MSTGKIRQSGEFRNGVCVTASEEIDVQYGIISCIVTDTEGNPVPEVEVDLSDGQSSITDGTGRAVFANHALGNYRLTIRVPAGYLCENPSASVSLTKQNAQASVQKILTKEKQEEDTEESPET